jgi:hypothetical protein
MTNEKEYQHELIKKLRIIFPGCFILQNDPSEFQGIPDLLILFGDRWSMLEVKKSPRARIGPNQQHYVDLFNEMSFAAFICPENEVEVLNELQRVLDGDRRFS